MPGTGHMPTAAVDGPAEFLGQDALREEDAPATAHRWNLLRAHLDSAEAMAALSKYRDAQEVRRDKDFARDSYQSAVRLLLAARLSEEQEREVWNRLAPIRGWLERG